MTNLILHVRRQLCERLVKAGGNKDWIVPKAIGAMGRISDSAHADSD